MYFGFIQPLNFGGAYIVSEQASSLTLIDFTHVGASQEHVRMQSLPSADLFTIKQNDITRFELSTSACTISSDLTVTGNITAPNLQNLTAVADDSSNGFRSLLGTGSATGKLKFLTGSSGISSFSSFEGVSFTADPTAFPDNVLFTPVFTDNVGQLNMSSRANNDFDPTYTFRDGPRFSSPFIGATTTANAFITYDIPSGAQSCFLHYLSHQDCGYMDVSGITSDGTELYINRVDMHPPFQVIYHQNYISGIRIACVASSLDKFSQIRFRVRKGAMFCAGVAFNSGRYPITQSSMVHGDLVYTSVASSSDRRLKENFTEVSGTQALNVLSNISCQTYDAFEQRRLGLIAQEVEQALEPLKIDNVVGSKLVSHQGKIDEYATLQYERLVPLLISAVNQLSTELAELKSSLPKKKNGSAHKSV